MSSTVFTMWDLHSEEKIFVPNYWKFPKETVLRLTFQHLLDGLEYLPEDIYVFDDALSVSAIRTHEYDLDGVDFYFLARPGNHRLD